MAIPTGTVVGDTSYTGIKMWCKRAITMSQQRRQRVGDYKDVPCGIGIEIADHETTRPACGRVIRPIEGKDGVREGVRDNREKCHDREAGREEPREWKETTRMESNPGHGRPPDVGGTSLAPIGGGACLRDRLDQPQRYARSAAVCSLIWEN